MAAEHCLALERTIVNMVVPLRSDKHGFHELFWTRGLIRLHSIIVAEVIKGQLPLDVGCRKGLVEMWFLNHKYRSGVRIYMTDLPTSVLALLSTLPIDDQVEVSQPVLHIIPAHDLWDSWLQCWMEKVCGGNMVSQRLHLIYACHIQFLLFQAVLHTLVSFYLVPELGKQR